MTYIVDQLFPPLKDDEGSIEFSNFNYWREPVVELLLDVDVVSAAAATALITNTNGSNPANILPTKSLATIPEN